MKKILKHLASLTAPQYLLITIFLPISAYMLLNSKMPGPEILPIILVFSIAAAGFNVTNMVFDAELDKLNKPQRPIPSGDIPKRTVIIMGISLYLLSVIIALFFNPILSAFAAFFVIVSYVYSAPPLRLRNYFWGSAMTGALIYGALPFISVQVISPPNYSAPVFFLFYVCLFFVISNTKDFEDVSGERKEGINSMATKFGTKLGAAIVVLLEFGIILTMGVLALVGVIENKFVYAVGFSLIILVAATVLFWNSISDLDKKNIIIERVDVKNLKDTIFEAQGVTISILLVCVIPLVFGIVAVIL